MPEENSYSWRGFLAPLIPGSVTIATVALWLFVLRGVLVPSPGIVEGLVALVLAFAPGLLHGAVADAMAWLADAVLFVDLWQERACVRLVDAVSPRRFSAPLRGRLREAVRAAYRVELPDLTAEDAPDVQEKKSDLVVEVRDLALLGACSSSCRVRLDRLEVRAEVLRGLVSALAIGAVGTAVIGFHDLTFTVAHILSSTTLLFIAFFFLCAAIACLLGARQLTRRLSREAFLGEIALHPGAAPAASAAEEHGAGEQAQRGGLGPERPVPEPGRPEA